MFPSIFLHTFPSNSVHETHLDSSLPSIDAEGKVLSEPLLRSLLAEDPWERTLPGESNRAAHSASERTLDLRAARSYSIILRENSPINHRAHSHHWPWRACVLIKPRIVLQPVLIVAKRPYCPFAGPASILPLSLGGQAIAPPRIPRSRRRHLRDSRAPGPRAPKADCRTARHETN